MCRFVYFDGCPLSRDLHTGESYSTKEHFLVWKHLEVVEIYRHEEEIYIFVREKKFFVTP
jgi:hypothetical protein